MKPPASQAPTPFFPGPFSPGSPFTTAEGEPGKKGPHVSLTRRPSALGRRPTLFGRTRLFGFRPPESPRGRPRYPVRRAAPSFRSSSCDTELSPPDRQRCGLTRLTSQRRLASPFTHRKTRLSLLSASRRRRLLTPVAAVPHRGPATHQQPPRQGHDGLLLACLAPAQPRVQRQSRAVRTAPWPGRRPRGSSRRGPPSAPGRAARGRPPRAAGGPRRRGAS